MSSEEIYVGFRGRKLRKEKKFLSGTHRCCTPEETFLKIEPVFERIGLTRLANITGLDRIGIPVVLSVRPNAGYLAVDAGKGTTVKAASVSAAMECIERYHGEMVETEEIVASYEELSESYNVIPLNRIPLIKNSIFTTKWTERWTLCWDIINQVEVAVPVPLVTMESHKYNQNQIVSFQMGSNGLASGNHILEAICSGLYEVVERDAVTCHRMAARSFSYYIPRVIQDSIEDPLVNSQLKLLEDAGVKTIIMDCTVDTDIPVYMAYVYDDYRRDIGVYRGYGAHLDPAVAMVRAINEAVQSRGIFIAGSRDDFFRTNFNRNKRTDQNEAIKRIEKNPSVVDASRRVSASSDSFEGDIHEVIKRLRRSGLSQLLVYDLTMEGFDVSVVRVIVPGLEGYLFDYYQPGERADRFILQQQKILAGGLR